jgi:hypothetical protein
MMTSWSAMIFEARPEDIPCLLLLDEMGSDK